MALHVPTVHKRGRNSEIIDRDNMYYDPSYYARLPDDDSDINDSFASGEWVHTTKKPRRIPKKVSVQIPVTPGQNLPQRKSAVPPPITIENVSVNQLLTHMKTLNLEKNQLMYRNTRGCTRIHTKDKETFEKVLAHCKTLKLAGFSHAPREDKEVKFCLYGLPKRDGAEIAKEMADLNIAPTKVRQLYQNKDYLDEVIYVVHFKKSQNVTLESLRQITGLFDIRVKFHYYQTNENQITQCSNCQGFGHGTQHCFKKAACVRCAGEHTSRECPLIPKPMDGAEPVQKPQIPIDQLKCVLCQKTGHSAAWRKCEVRIQQEKTREAFRHGRHNIQIRRRAPAPNVQSQAHFPQLKRSNVHPLQTAHHRYQPAPAPEIPQSNVWHARPMGTAGPELIPVNELMNIFHSSVSELMQCKTPEQQISTIIGLAARYVQNYRSNYNR